MQLHLLAVNNSVLFLRELLRDTPKDEIFDYKSPFHVNCRVEECCPQWSGILVDWSRFNLGPVHTTSKEFENRGFTLKTHQMFSVHASPEKFENKGFTLKTHQMFSVLTTPEKFENKGFTLKTHQMFSVHTTPEEFKNATITGHFGFVFEENSVRKITWLSWRHRFRKAPSSKCFPSIRIRKAGVFKFLRFGERFRKFSWRISVDGRPNFKNKAAFSNYSSVDAVLDKRLLRNICDCIQPRKRVNVEADI